MTAEPFIPTPEMIAAAWGVLRDRWPNQPHLLGPGLGFREAIEAAFAVMPSLPEIRPAGACDHLAEGCCSAIRPCRHQRLFPSELCISCSAVRDHAALSIIAQEAEHG